ncbi:MAG: ABC transporter permease [Acidimicrobiaceae bacterium]|nr:ABC transporter permease [Acidimicrobiaceae bacterium]MDE0517220.1 ABC transporter permease [Acidimicrobiaceae bacterium]
MAPVAPSRLGLWEAVRVGLRSLAARKLRSVLSALGIAIGIASLVGVLGLSESSKSALLDQISALGTNLLTIEAGTGFGAGDAALPETALKRVGRVATVEAASAVYSIDVGAYRNELVPADRTGGIQFFGTDPGLVRTLNGGVAHGSFLTAATTSYPAAVVGSVAAERLGIRNLDQPVLLYVGGRWIEVQGVLEPFALAADLDRAVLIGDSAAESYYEVDLAPSRLYLRVDQEYLDETRGVLGATVDPENPEEVQISRPSDLLEAQAAAESSFTGLFLGLGAVALIVGGIGIANVMVMGVVERRGEIGLRRAIGATRAHIRRQFLTEALTLAFLGGAAGIFLGVAVTYAYSAVQGWRVIVPLAALLGGIAASLAIGAIAGLYPAIRAARVSPTEALRSA